MLCTATCGRKSYRKIYLRNFARKGLLDGLCIITAITVSHQKTQKANLPLAEYKSCKRERRAISSDADRLFPSSTTSQKVAAVAVERDDAVETSGIAALRPSERRTINCSQRWRRTAILALCCCCCYCCCCHQLTGTHLLMWLHSPLIRPPELEPDI